MDPDLHVAKLFFKNVNQLHYNNLIILLTNTYGGSKTVAWHGLINNF
jgi:hypothetical protein